MVTSNRLIAMLTAPRTPMSNGQIKHTIDQLGRSSAPPGSGAARRLLEAIAAQPVTEHRTVPHPEHRAVQVAGARPADSLTDSDRMWLSMLDRDPKTMTFEDAEQLAALARITKPGTPDRRLIDAFWKPVKAHYDKLAAEADLANATRARTTIPNGAVDAVAELLRHERPGIGAEEATTIAREELTRAAAVADRAAGLKQADAEAQLHALQVA